MSELKPCPFCGVKPEVTKHFKHDLYGLVHRCETIGAVVMDFADKGRNEERWNRRHATPDSSELREAMLAGATALQERGEFHIYGDGKIYSRTKCNKMSEILRREAK